MADKFSSNIKPYLVSNLIQALRSNPAPGWKKQTAYTLGTQVSNAGRVYSAINNGVTSITPPTQNSGLFLDGTVQWLYVGQINNQTDVASNLYLGIGDTLEWVDPTTPDAPSTGSESESFVQDNLVTLIKVNPTNVRQGLKIYTWATNTVYSQFDSAKDPSEYDTAHPLYIVNGSDVYKCIDNANGVVSTVLPSGKSLNLLRLADKYVWKYMGSVTSADSSTFQTSQFIPVTFKTSNDGSDQWAVQQAALEGSLSTFGKVFSNNAAFTSPVVSITGSGAGAIASFDLSPSSLVQHIYISSPGSGYDAQTYAVVKNSAAAGTGASTAVSVTAGAVALSGSVTPGTNYVNASLVIVGDGENAAGTVTVSGGQVTNVTITTAGTGYTWAKAFIVAGPAAAVSQSILAPAQGHGSNIVTELCTNALLMSFKITNSDTDYITDVDYRQISLFSSVQADANSVSNSNMFIGPSHPQYSSSSTLNKYSVGSGYMLYLNNVPVIEHTYSQEETLKIAIAF
jgi:hypothetical protein